MSTIISAAVKGGIRQFAIVSIALLGLSSGAYAQLKPGTYWKIYDTASPTAHDNFKVIYIKNEQELTVLDDMAVTLTLDQKKKRLKFLYNADQPCSYRVKNNKLIISCGDAVYTGFQATEQELKEIKYFSFRKVNISLPYYSGSDSLLVQGSGLKKPNLMPVHMSSSVKVYSIGASAPKAAYVEVNGRGAVFGALELSPNLSAFEFAENLNTDMFLSQFSKLPSDQKHNITLYVDKNTLIEDVIIVLRGLESLKEVEDIYIAARKDGDQAMEPYFYKFEKGTNIKHNIYPTFEQWAQSGFETTPYEIIEIIEVDDEEIIEEAPAISIPPKDH